MDRFRLSDDLTNQSWPEDMTDSLAIMAPLPKVRGGDRSAYIDQWETDIVECFGPHFGDLNGQQPVFSYYQRPPAAGEYTDFIFTLALDVNGFIQTIDAYVWMGAALIEFLKRRKEHEPPDRGPQGDSRPPFYTTVRGIEAMCLHHAVNTYVVDNQPVNIRVSTTSRNTWVGSALHPSPDVQYTVAISLNGTQYVYVTEATAKVIEHFSINEAGIVGLELPEWGQEDPSFDPYKPVSVEPLITSSPPFDPGPRFRSLGSVD